MLAAGERACTAASAATLRSTLSGVPSAPEPLPTSWRSRRLSDLCDLRLSPRPSLVWSRLSFLSLCFERSLLRSCSRSLPEDVALDSRGSVHWELTLGVRWLLLLLLRLLLLCPPPSPSLLMLLQAL